MRLHIARMHHEMKTTMVYVTHDQVEAMTLADKIVVMNFGKVEQVGAPMDLYYNPCNKFVAGFIGSPKMNFIPTTISKVEPGFAHVALDGQDVKIPALTDGVKAGDKVTVGIRPEYISIGAIQKSLEVLGGEPGVTLNFDSDVVERLGNNTYVYGTCCGQDNFKVILPGDVHAPARQKTQVSTLIKNIMLFNEKDERIYANEKQRQNNQL